ncbi:MAG: hypothetical protein NDJ94_15475 [Vicinamibacteria bacterium]|nr:hypothetical protein [Vicinamibacteria bacterium]
MLTSSPQACARALRVFTEAAAAEGGPSLLGTSACDASGVRFTPRFPFVPGLAHRAVLDLRPWGGPRVESSFAASDERGGPSTSVVAVTPSGPEVPENLLKLYVHFSAPISAGWVRAHVRLVDALSDEPVPAPFAEGGAELWDPEHQRLTLLLDPGRIKQGLRGEAEQGPPLRAGRRYRLEVASGLRDTAGLPLRAPFRHELSAGPADHAQPDPAAWTLTAPHAHTRAPLEVRFPEPLDAALLGHALTVERDGGAVAGVVAIAPGERGWTFTPDLAWPDAPHELVVDPRLEDLAGNNLRRAFDRDLEALPTTPALPPPTRLPFRPRP